jgi:hypothetical protein
MNVRFFSSIFCATLTHPFSALSTAIQALFASGLTPDPNNQNLKTGFAGQQYFTLFP